MNVKKQADNAVMASRFLADARFQVYLDYARRHVDTVDRERLVDLAVRLYRWNVEASAITIGYIGYIEIFVRNAIDHRLCEWVSGQQITGIPDWLEAGKSDPIGRIRALINSPERDYIAEARNTALRKQRHWRSDQTHPRHGDAITRDDVFSQLTLGTWDGMLSRSGKDPELAHVLMGAFPNIADAWASELRRMPKGRLPCVCQIEVVQNGVSIQSEKAAGFSPVERKDPPPLLFGFYPIRAWVRLYDSPSNLIILP